jgi:glycosyltransferase involved in cell wall biosynthesis
MIPTQPMKVAILGPYPAQPSRPDGGVETVVRVLCKEMARRPEVELRVFSCAGARKGQTSELEDGLTRCLIPRRRLGRATFYWRDVRALRECLREFRPDLAHAHGAGLYAAAALSGDFPVAVITPHGIVAREARLVTGLRERIGWRLQALWEARVLRRARHIIAISPYVEQELAHLSRARFHLIENPVDDRYFSLGDPAPSGCVLWVGRLIPRKDPQTAIRAFAIVRRAFPRARLRIVGEATSCPAYARATRDLPAQLGLSDSVEFLRHLDQNALINEYEAAQLVLITSVQETAPVVIAEAMAGGRPVVATDAGGCRYLIRSGETGLLAPKGDEVTLARHVSTLLASPDLTFRLSEAARREAQERFGAALAVDRTLDLYRNLLSLTPSSGQFPNSAQATKL